MKKGLNNNWLLCLLLVVTVTGCGGGGKSSARTQTDPPPPPPPSSDAGLASLNVSAASLDQIFQSAIHDYTGNASYLAGSTTITAQVSDPGATMVINGLAAQSGVASDPIDLAQGTNTITVTVTAEDGINSQSYTLDIVRGAATTLAPLTYIKAANSAPGDQFGAAVAASGDTLAIVASREDSSAVGVDGDATDDSATSSGAVYVFRLDATKTWTQEAYIKASNTSSFDEFGYSIALSGDTLAVGAFREDSAATGVDGDQTDNTAVDSGAVYIFARNTTGVWTQQAYIKASNGQSIDAFGVSVALSGDTLVVGAHLEDSMATGVNGDQADNSLQDSGAAYVFTRDIAGVWSQQAYLKASNTDAGDQFGQAIALSGDTLAVAATGERSKSTGIDGNQSSNSWADAGAVYVFTRDGTDTWSQQAYIKASNTGSGDTFGAAVALSNGTLIVGAAREDSAARGVDGFQADNKALNSGAAYVFTRDASNTWSQQAYIKASNADIQDQFGHALALDGDLLMVGAREDSAASGTGGDEADNSATNSGAVYLFVRDLAGTWSQSAYLKSSNTDIEDGFGSGMALGGGFLVIGAHLEDSAAAGVGGDQADNNATESGAAYIVR